MLKLRRKKFNMANEKVKAKSLKKDAKSEVKPMAKETVKKTEVKNTNKIMKGTVVSTKMQNTVVVAIERKVAHKLYGKLIKVTKRIKADTNGISVSEGDFVVIEQTKPISKDKNFKVIRKEEANGTA